MQQQGVFNQNVDTPQPLEELVLHTFYQKSLQNSILNDHKNIAYIYLTESAVLVALFNNVIFVAEFVTMMTSK